MRNGQVAGQQVSVETSHGSNIIVDSGLHISIDLDMNKMNKNKKDNYNGIHIEGNLSIESILNSLNHSSSFNIVVLLSMGNSSTDLNFLSMVLDFLEAVSMVLLAS